MFGNAKKGRSCTSLSSAFVCRARKKFALVKIVGIYIVACAKLRKPVCIYESLQKNVINEAHNVISYGDCEKTTHELNCHYFWVHRFSAEIFLKQCVSYQIRKLIEQHALSKPIISSGIMTRLQIDLINTRTRSDKVTSNLAYYWFLNGMRPRVRAVSVRMEGWAWGWRGEREGGRGAGDTLTLTSHPHLSPSGWLIVLFLPKKRTNQQPTVFKYELA